MKIQVLAWGAVICLALCCFPATADIPHSVDYHASWDGLPPFGGGAWDIVNDDLSYGTPLWDPDGQDDFTRLLVPNEQQLNKHKLVWVEVEYWRLVPSAQPQIDLLADGEVSFLGAVKQGEFPDAGSWTLQWMIDPQPPREFIQFPNTDFYNANSLDNSITLVEVGTDCIPEPPTLGLLVLGFTGILVGRGKSFLGRK